MSDLNLKSDFPEITNEEWRNLVEAGLRATTYADLLRKTEDGLSRGPLMTEADRPKSTVPLTRTQLDNQDKRPWHIAAPVRGKDLKHANTQLLDDLEGGASAIRIENGDALKNRNDLKRLLEGVFTDLVPLQITPNSNNAACMEFAKSVTPLTKSTIWVGLDPQQDKSVILDNLSEAPKPWKLMTLAPRDVHERGGTDVQELAIMAAHLTEAMREYGPDIVCRHMVIELAADQDTHLTISKFRASRRIIQRIAEAFGVNGSAIPICAVTSLRMMQTEDAWTNLLRVMSAGFGAILGGADMVTTRPFTDGLGQATPFAHRIARNMQLMMMEESHVGQVSDAGHGSFWHEHMTEEIAQAAWRNFKNIEQKGGIYAYLESGELETDLESAIAARTARAEPILGVTLHPTEGVKAPEVRS